MLLRLLTPKNLTNLVHTFGGKAVLGDVNMFKPIDNIVKKTVSNIDSFIQCSMLLP